MDWLVVLLRFALLLVLYAFLLAVLRLLRAEVGAGARVGAAKPLPLAEGPAPAAAMVPGRLVVEETAAGTGWQRGNSITLGEITTIGRGRPNDLVVADPHVSLRHARLLYREPHFYLQDLGSTNGTYVNGQRVAGETRLYHGDTLRVGGVTFRLVRWDDAGGSGH